MVDITFRYRPTFLTLKIQNVVDSLLFHTVFFIKNTISSSKSTDNFEIINIHLFTSPDSSDHLRKHQDSSNRLYESHITHYCYGYTVSRRTVEGTVKVH